MDIKHIIKKTLTSTRMSNAGRLSSEQKKRFPELSEREWSEVKTLWKVKMDNEFIKIYPKGYRIFKALEGFDARYCPNTIFESYILRALNLPVHVMALEHKALYDMVFSDMLQPKTLVKRINGTYYDCNRNCILLNDSYLNVKSGGGN